MSVHELTTTRTADELEGLDGMILLDPGTWEARGPHGAWIHSGDDITLTSAEGDVFIGTFLDGPTDDGAILIELR